MPYPQRVRRVAGLPEDFTMIACRHGGLTELRDAEATDQEMMASGGHKTRKMLTTYGAQRRRRRSTPRTKGAP